MLKWVGVVGALLALSMFTTDSKAAYQDSDDIWPGRAIQYKRIAAKNELVTLDVRGKSRKNPETGELHCYVLDSEKNVMRHLDGGVRNSCALLWMSDGKPFYVMLENRSQDWHVYFDMTIDDE